MISPELLRRYRCFGSLGDGQLRAIAMISTEASFKWKAVLFKEGELAVALCLLTSGSADLSFTIGQEDAPKSRKDLPVGEINAGEMFGVSALIEPHVYTATARAAKDGGLIKINGPALLKLWRKIPALGTRSCAMWRVLWRSAFRRHGCSWPRPEPSEVMRSPLPGEGPGYLFV